MIPIKQFLNKIKYSKKFNPKEITICYQDRFIKKLIPAEFKNITIEENLFITNNKTIPLHRIREIRKKGVIIWKR
ncbi:MAG: DUF504 domain-containing protein [Candidatus Woesearchaeota archaeon]